MRKEIILMLGLVWRLEGEGSVEGVEKESVGESIDYEVGELVEGMEGVYVKGVVVGGCGRGKWFVRIWGGGRVFVGRGVGCEEVFGGVKGW